MAWFARARKPRLRPIRLVRDGDWLKADGATLGADNGVSRPPEDRRRYLGA